ncbi:MAG: hypothetical protein P4L76_04145 [Beijerinckiaceae bacterium]|nr:hypothetical protein [Beijerinckiaceae bacterium]
MVYLDVRPKEEIVTEDLVKLLEAARKITPSPEQREEHRRSFAYGNTSIENKLITREMIDAEADKLAGERHGRHAKAP